MIRLVEMCDGLVPDTNMRHRPMILKLIDELAKNLRACTDHRALKITSEGIVCQDKDGKEVLVPGRSVICALGQRFWSAVVDELRDAAPFVQVSR